LPISPAANPESSTTVAAQTPTDPAQYTRSTDNYGFGALTFYLLLSALFFGRALAGHLSDYHVGVGVPSDVSNFVWSLAWWRHA
jgi:hypothetical protein